MNNKVNLLKSFSPNDNFFSGENYYKNYINNKNLFNSKLLKNKWKKILIRENKKYSNVQYV